MAEHTPGPWVQFADQGKCIAIMPAMREGDVCTFKQSPSDADARLIAAALALFSALYALDVLLDFSDEKLEPIWTFEDVTSIQTIFTQAKVILSQLAAPVAGGPK